MTHLFCVAVLHRHRMKVVASFRNQNENASEHDVANVWKEMIKVAEVNEEPIRIGASEVVITHILVSRRDHHLQLKSIACQKLV